MSPEREEDYFSWLPGDVEWETPLSSPPPPPKEDPLSVAGEGLTTEVREHGELGPLLTNAEHDFTAQDDIDNRKDGRNG